LEAALEVVVILAALATIPLTIIQFEGTTRPGVIVADWVIWSIFVIDYAAKMAWAESKWAQARRDVLGAAVIVLSFPALPALLALTRLVRLTRLARLFRLFRLIAISARGIRGLRVVFARRGLLYLVALATVFVLAGGAAVSLVEPATTGGGFWNGVWWAIVTTTTVGYGDIAPESAIGRGIAVVLMLAGLGVVATLAASVAAYFVTQPEEGQQSEVDERLTRIEGMLEHLMRQSQTSEQDPRRVE
jgi:voltage-gated potassium channel